MVTVGLAIVIGGLIGLPALHFGRLELGLSKAVGALLGGLVAGWLRSVNPRFGRIPEPALWIFDSLGLNVFIGLVGTLGGSGVRARAAGVGPRARRAARRSSRPRRCS